MCAQTASPDYLTYKFKNVLNVAPTERKNV